MTENKKIKTAAADKSEILDEAKQVSDEVHEDKPVIEPDASTLKPKSHLSKRNKVIIAAVAAVVVVVVVGVGVGVALAKKPDLPVVPNNEPPTSQASLDTTKHELAFTLKVDGMPEDATPGKAIVYNKDQSVAITEFQVVANKQSEIGELAQGDYELKVTQAPVAPDGSTAKLLDTPTSFSVGDSKAEVSVELEKIDASGMTKEQLEAAAQALADAGKQDAAQSVSEHSASAPSHPGSDGAVVKPDAGGGSAPDPHNGKTWHEAVYEQRWVPNVVTVTDKPAWDEVVITGEKIVFSDGHVCYTDEEATAYEDSFVNQGKHAPSYSVQYIYGNVHHDAVTHTEDQGHYEQVLIREAGWY